MKKILALILALALVFALAACKSDDNKASSPSDTGNAGANDSNNTGANQDGNNTGANENQGNTTPDIPVIPDVTDAPVDILKNTWAKVADDQKFPVGGGDANHTDFEGPGIVEDKDFMMGVLLIPEAEIAKIDAAGSFMHMMNANTFTCGAYHLTNAADVEAFAQTMRDTIKNNQWMCGFPDKMFIAKVGTSNVVVLFGVSGEFGDAVTPVTTALSEAYGDAVTVLFEEAVAQ